MINLYLSASTQAQNGTPYYGTEQDNMFELRSMVWNLLKNDDRFEVFVNLYGWTLSQTILDCNNNDCDLAIDLHSNATLGGTGFEALCLPNGQAEIFASHVLQQYIDNIELTNRGKKYRYNLGFLNNISCPSIIVESFFHDNNDDVDYFNANRALFAKAIYDGICTFVALEPLVTVPDEVETDVDNDEIITELKGILEQANDGMLRVSMIQCNTLENTRNAYKLVRDLTGCVIKLGGA